MMLFSNIQETQIILLMCVLREVCLKKGCTGVLATSETWVGKSLMI